MVSLLLWHYFLYKKLNHPHIILESQSRIGIGIVRDYNKECQRRDELAITSLQYIGMRQIILGCQILLTTSAPVENVLTNKYLCLPTILIVVNHPFSDIYTSTHVKDGVYIYFV